jgi:hypothetical protein
MPSTDRKVELKAKTSVAQSGSQPFVYAKGLNCPRTQLTEMWFSVRRKLMNIIALFCVTCCVSEGTLDLPSPQKHLEDGDEVSL